MYATIMKGSYGAPCKACGKVHSSACEAEAAHVEKANPHHGPDGKFTHAPGTPTGGKEPTPAKVSPVFGPKAKVTIQQAAAALAKQGFKMKHAGMGKNFKPNYELTDSKGNVTVMSSTDLLKGLTKKLDSGWKQSMGF